MNARANLSSLAAAGAVAMIAGLAGAMYFLAVFSVAAPGGESGQRIANLDLMNQRQIGVIFCGVVAVVGAILFAAGMMTRPDARPERSGSGRPIRIRGGLQCPRCGLINSETASRCDCGLMFV